MFNNKNINIMALRMNVYLKFKDTCKEAFAFYSTVFKTDLTYSTTYGEQEEMSFVQEKDKHKILHCGLYLDETTMLWGCDVLEGHDMRWDDSRHIEGTNVIMSLNPESEDEARLIFSKLSEGGNIITPLEHTFWGAYYGLVTDKFGINWMINYTNE